MVSYTTNCEICEIELNIEMEGGYLWEGSFACEKCVEDPNCGVQQSAKKDNHMVCDIFF